MLSTHCFAKARRDQDRLAPRFQGAVQLVGDLDAGESDTEIGSEVEHLKMMSFRHRA